MHKGWGGAQTNTFLCTPAPVVPTTCVPRLMDALQVQTKLLLNETGMRKFFSSLFQGAQAKGLRMRRTVTRGSSAFSLDWSTAQHSTRRQIVMLECAIEPYNLHLFGWMNEGMTEGWRDRRRGKED
ncbi:hypothetical protein JOB18_044966 [Solea senegalensis]|uniref:Uncharacterized protein n=1 Tax=Solea senegalensis TaxID=28829 RepID=A0AAV6S5G1_SOLSE|nr:hypothetical protein JOB18_044966 [Solea senegalensis]